MCIWDLLNLMCARTASLMKGEKNILHFSRPFFDCFRAVTRQCHFFPLTLTRLRTCLYLSCKLLHVGKTPDQIRETFNIRTDFTQEEEDEIRAAHKDLLN